MRKRRFSRPWTTPGTTREGTDYDYGAGGYLSQSTNEVGHVTDIISVNGRDRCHAKPRPRPGGRRTRVRLRRRHHEDRPDGSWLGCTYDDTRRVTTTTSDLGEAITYGYNNASDVTSVEVRSSTGAIVASRTLAYDEIGRLRRLIGAGLKETSLTYDKADNPSTMTDPRGGLYDYAFDRLDRLVSETDPELGETSISYDQRDNITVVEDAENLSTTFVVNGFGDVIRRSSPDTGVTDYMLDPRGRVTSTTDARGVTTEFTYDALGRVLTKSFPAAPTENVTFAYDDTTGGNHGVGRLTGFADPSGSTAYQYDALGRVVEVSQTIAGDGFTTGYQYDSAGRVVEMTYPSGRVMTFTRDSIGRVTGITTKESASATPETVASDIEYLPFHPADLFTDGAAAPGLDMPHLDGLAGFTHGNGLSLLLNYDADGRLTGMSTADGSTQVQDLTLAFDAAADITAITDNLDPSRSQAFGYDGVGRLIYASGAYGEIDYSYDLVGNRTHRTIDDGTLTDEVYAYGTGSHPLESVTVGAATRDFAYTAAGSTASDTRAGTPLAFTYNQAGRLKSVTAASGTLASRGYTYDALQHRVRETKADRVGGGVQASVRSFVCDLDGHLIAEYATLGLTPSVRREYVWLGDTPVVMIARGGSLLAIHTDHLGRPQKLTNAAQAVVWDGQFDPFGEEHAVAGTTVLPLRFPGQEWDAATGLSQNWNRDYDPTLGRYIESDPIGLAGGMSTYGYAGGRPLRLTDRKGLETKRCARGLGGPDKPPKPPRGNPFRHDYLVVDGRVYSFVPEGNPLLSEGDVKRNEVVENGLCETVSRDPDFDRAVEDSVREIGEPYYNIYAYPYTSFYPHGARNCQTWVDDVLDRAEDILRPRRRVPR